MGRPGEWNKSLEWTATKRKMGDLRQIEAVFDKAKSSNSQQ